MKLPFVYSSYIIPSHGLCYSPSLVTCQSCWGWSVALMIDSFEIRHKWPDSSFSIVRIRHFSLIYVIIIWISLGFGWSLSLWILGLYSFLFPATWYDKSVRSWTKQPVMLEINDHCSSQIIEFIYTGHSVICVSNISTCRGAQRLHPWRHGAGSRGDEAAHTPALQCQRKPVQPRHRPDLPQKPHHLLPYGPAHLCRAQGFHRGPGEGGLPGYGQRLGPNTLPRIHCWHFTEGQGSLHRSDGV